MVIKRKIVKFFEFQMGRCFVSTLLYCGLCFAVMGEGLASVLLWLLEYPFKLILNLNIF